MLRTLNFTILLQGGVKCYKWENEIQEKSKFITWKNKRESYTVKKNLKGKKKELN